MNPRANPKTRLSLVAALLAAAWSLAAVPARAEIQDDEASAQFLAAKIVESAGGTVDQYLNYARRLAKTLSQFSSAQQQAILGIVTGGSPSGKSGSQDDGNNGHGNDSDHDDDSNPGNH